MPRLSAAIAISLCVLSGCGRGESTGSVAGDISFNGKPLPTGIVAFHYPDGRVVSGGIQDGRYTIPQAPTGAVQIAVQTPPESKPGNAATEAPKGGAMQPSVSVGVPAKYGKPETSGLSFTVAAGNQTHPLDLK